ncbi:MAG: glycosyl hydrolase family 8, partial [Patescibacteria group bacterium]|nr:glycosyl hydrolase family 8 [Patescibacteria group bacterium]
MNPLMYKRATILLLAILAIAAMAHGVNMFHFPYYENDEGTYLSRAWSLLRDGSLSPYTYWYDHAPGGTFLLAFWAIISGGFFTFGQTAIDSGRVFMLVLHVGSVGLLFYITRRLAGTLRAATIAAFLFALSPLALYYARRVLLDNMMTFLALGSVALLLRERLTLRTVLGSALLLGLAILTKENAIFFIPPFLYLLFTRTDAANRRFSIALWFTAWGSIVASYFLYALLKGELFVGSRAGEAGAHVSLIGTLAMHLGRGAAAPFWSSASDFAGAFLTWVERDAFIIIFGAMATLAGVVLAVRRPAFRSASFLSLSAWAFLLRGKLVLDFYVLPLLPLLSLVIAMCSEELLLWLGRLSQRTRRIRAGAAVIFFLGTVVGIAVLFPHPLSIFAPYTRNETRNQREAVAYIKEHLLARSFIAIDQYAYLDLHDTRSSSGERVFPNAHWFWQIETDPAVRVGVFGNDPRALEYVALSHEMVRQMQGGGQVFLREALAHADLIKDWTASTTSYLDLEDDVSTNGDWAQLYEVHDERRIELERAWTYYKDAFIKNYGQVVDPWNGITTSEGQAYALLRAVWMDDRPMFDGLFAWTRDHLEFRGVDHLFSWRWGRGENGVERVLDSEAASDADQDIALALLLAHRRWGEDAYRTAAEEIIRDIWRREVVRVAGRYYLTAGPGAARPDGYLLNPSYLSPAAYRLFAEADPEHDWLALAKDSYALLERLGSESARGNLTGLPPNWTLLDGETGALLSAAHYISTHADAYGYDAFRALWRVALDALWFKEPRAERYLRSVAPFFEREWQEHDTFASVYRRTDGVRLLVHGDLAPVAGAISALFRTNPDLAHEIERRIFDATFNAEGFWGERTSY